LAVQDLIISRPYLYIAHIQAYSIAGNALDCPFCTYSKSWFISVHN